ncbi:MAG TPA: hypothetical protein VIL85_22835 [Thermomicrobiales bacterium]
MAFTKDNFHVPTELRTDEFLLRPIRAADAALDYEAVMASKEYLRPWEGTGWPADDFTVEDNRADVVKLARWHAARERFTYTVLDPTETQCFGCVYIVPTGAPLFARKQIAAIDGARWSEYAVVVHFWVRTARLADGLDRRLLDVLGPWLAEAWQIPHHLIVTNERVEQQVSLIESTNRQLRFRLTDPKEPGASLAYAQAAPPA